MTTFTKILITILVFIFYIALYITSKGKSKEDKNIALTVLYILFIPTCLILFDMWDYFAICLPEVYKSFTSKYDILSFLGTYISAIISTFFIIWITAVDRNKNTHMQIISQRPLLDVKIGIVDKQIIKEYEKNNDNSLIYIANELEIKQKEKYKNFQFVKITNKGASTAVLNSKEIEIKCKYIIKDIDGYKEHEIIFKDFADRVIIAPNEKIYIVILESNLYEKFELKIETNVVSTHIEYKDLFNKNYVDEVEFFQNRQEVKKDNNLIDEEKSE